jgi:hypothetical protein
LSEAYRDDAAEARSRRWPTLEVLGTHLDIVNRPSAVASSILEIVSA